MKNGKTSVMVGMSGGVDSSTVAAILHKQGYNVVGVTLQLYKQEDIIGKSKTCCGSKDIYDAKRVCSAIGIPHYVINYESTFKTKVVDDFVESYKSGSTPIPCIRCNQSVKFNDMLKVSEQLGIDYIATGHYVKRVESQDGEIQMHKAADQSKDQSYFLFSTTRHQLSKTLFPLGEYTKAQTRQIASELGVPIAQKSESQDICFIPDGNYGNFLIKIDPSLNKPGEIVMQSTGLTVGKHSGAVFFTKGQRRGIGIGGNVKPLYVTDVDVKNNIVYVGEEELLFRDTFFISEMNFLSIQHESMDTFECDVVLRALQHPIPATISRISFDEYKVKLQNNGRAITKGQACVMYKENMVLGGGFIQKIV